MESINETHPTVNRTAPPLSAADLEPHFSAAEAAGATGMPGTHQGVTYRMQNCPDYRIRPGAGREKEFPLRVFPPEARAWLLRKYGIKNRPSDPEREKAEREEAQVSSEERWVWFNTITEEQREAAKARLMVVADYFDLVDTGAYKKGEARELVAEKHDVSAATLRGWLKKVKDVPREDWLPELASRYAGVSREAQCHPDAWDYLVADYLDRSKPDFTSSYRRMTEAGGKHGWTYPCEKTLFRRMEKEYSLETRTYLREGAEALNKLYPKQQRDKSVFAAGEAVNGDGLKFDKLWIRFPDGEILNTTTAWFWADIRTNKILAWRAGKTENTDLIRLATYDLTAICLPKFAWLDNTRAAANKVMTGQAPGRHRFKNGSDDPPGIMLQVGITPRFTNPDHEVSNPGVKPVERSFGIGGLHSEVATNPRLRGRGYSKATAIPFEEFNEVLAQEVVRFNDRKGRRTPICRGILSFDEAFEENFSTSCVRIAKEAQRRMLLLIPEKVTVNRQSGEVAIKAGQGPGGKNRYWSEKLSPYRSKPVVVNADPANLHGDVYVYELSGKFICVANWLPGTAYNDTAAAREWHKAKKAKLKADKKSAEAAKRMTDAEMQALYPAPEDAPEPPEPGVVEATFGKTGRVELDGAPPYDREAEQDEVEERFGAVVNGAFAQWKKQREDDL